MPELAAHFGSPTQQTTLKQVRSRGAGVLLDIDTEEHDLGLLRALAEAVRADDEVVEHLQTYARIRNDLDDMEQGRTRLDHREREALRDEAADLANEIGAAMDLQAPGDGLTVAVDANDTATLTGALVRVVAEQIAAAERDGHHDDAERAMSLAEGSAA